MSDTSWERVKAIFADAAELPPDGRALFLDSACAANGELRVRVEALLSADEEAGDFLSEPTQDEGARNGLTWIKKVLVCNKAHVCSEEYIGCIPSVRIHILKFGK